MIAIISRPKEKTALPIKTEKTPSFAMALPKAITSSLKTIMLIYGTSVFFFLIATIINHYYKFPLLEYIIINGFFDLTNGIFLTSLITNPIIKGIIIICFISFGGISVHMQTKSIITNTKIKYRNFLLGRIYQMIIATTLFLWIVNW